MKPRELWATRLGVILAMAGNAIGLGNFLRFPVQAAQNGGGAFMIPYFAALLLLGVPLMWCEWAMGRYGGHHRHGSSPGVFDLLWKHPAAKYLGLLGICLPIGVTLYYDYVESWTLAYACFSLTGQFAGRTDLAGMKSFMDVFQGTQSAWGVSPASYSFFLLTVALNYWVLSGGIAKGIERLAMIGMPVLFLLAVVLVVRVFTIGTPDPAEPDRNVLNGLGFLWNPDLSQLRNAKVWLAAAGQVFFTLSVGFGAVQCYASYLRRKDDIVVTGLATSVTNEFAEVILGGSIAIPVAFAFFGADGALAIAKGGSFDLGFAAMPVIFQKIAGGPVLGFMWFLLLFIAGVTSSVALAQPAITFLQDELGWSHKRSLRTVGLFILVFAHVPVLGLKAGALGELDFWAGTVGLALFAFIECILFIWLFGADRAWAEIHEGAEERVPRIFFYVLKYVTPLFLGIIFVAWIWQTDAATWTLAGKSTEQKLWCWGARALLIGMAVAVALLIRHGWMKRRKEAVS